MRPLRTLREKIDSAIENGEDAARVVNTSLPKILRIFASYSGKTQAELAADTQRSASYIQKLFSTTPTSSVLPEKVEAAFGIPVSMFDDVDSFTLFFDINGVYVSTLDALLETYPSGGAKVRSMPIQYILMRLQEDEALNEALNTRVLTDEESEELTNYFIGDPSAVAEPDGNILRKLERLLALPKGAVSDPAGFAETKSVALVVERDLKQAVADNVARQLNLRGLNETQLAHRAAVPESAVNNLLHQERHPCTMKLVCALAVALDVPVQKLLSLQPTEVAEDESEIFSGFFEGLPNNVKNFLISYVTLVRERDAAGPTAGAKAALLLTPLLGQSFEWFGIAAKDLAAGAGSITDLGSLLAGVEQRMRLAR